MALNFRVATQRHMEDADLLYANARKPNADHLYGLATECMLKELACCFKPDLRTSSNDIDGSIRLHINKLWNKFIALACGPQAEEYVAFLESLDSPFSDWDIAQRYEDDSFFCASSLESHRQAAHKVYTILQKARADGVIG